MSSAALRIIALSAAATVVFHSHAQYQSTSSLEQELPDKSQLVKAPPKDVALENLRAHGVNGNASDVLAFLENGFPQSFDRKKMPTCPVEKTQLAIDAMSRLTHLRAAEAVPVIRNIAALKMPGGVQMLIDEDLKQTSPEGREGFRNKALHLLQYNAVNALSNLGDTASLELIRAIYAGERSAAARIQYTLCLAILGEGSGVDYLVEVILQENRRDSVGAARVFYIITGQDFGYTENTPLRARRQLARKYREWWNANRSSFKVDTKAVLARRVEPRIRPFQPRSTRDLLKLASYYFDFENELHTTEAREQLASSGRAINPELERLASDEGEELNIRLEAINWHYEANRSGSWDLLKKLRRDENPEIAEKAESLLQQIEEDQQAREQLRQLR